MLTISMNFLFMYFRYMQRMVSCILLYDDDNKTYCRLFLMEEIARQDAEVRHNLVDSLRYHIGEDKLS